jgi:uncharacterized protein
VERIDYPVIAVPRRRGASGVAAAGLAFLLLESAIAEASGADARLAALAAIGVAIGATLLGTNFGFSNAFRRAAELRDFTIFRAHALMFALAAAIIVPLIAAGSALGLPLEGFATPIGPSFVLGAALFGVGMQMSGGCASGTLYLLGGGNGKFAVVLVAFVLGSTVGAAHMGFWWSLPALPPVTVFTIGPWPLALAGEIGLFAAVAIATTLLAGSGQQGLPRSLRNGAIALALLNGATVLVAGRPWSETYGFALWGSKLAAALGWHPEGWAFWQGSPALQASIFTDKTSIMDLSILIGAFLAGAWNGSLALRLGGSWKSVLSGVLGGFAMGYGARLSGGCNIGAYFSAMASGDLSGWVWAAVALSTTALGLGARRLIER